MALEADDESRAQRTRPADHDDRITRVLLGLSHHLARAESMQEVAELVADAVPRVLDVESTAVLLWDHDDECLRTVVARGLPEELAAAAVGYEVRPGDVPGLAGIAAASDVRAFDTSSKHPFVRDALAEFGIDTAVAAPIRSGDHLVGVVTAILPRGSPRHLSDIDVDYLSGLADLAATALEVARNREEVRKRSDTTRVLLDLAETLAKVAEPRVIAERIAEVVPRLCDADASAVLLFDRERSVLRMEATWGWPEHLADAVRGFEVATDASPRIEEVLEGGAPPMYVTPSLDDPVVSAVLEEFETDAALVVPIEARGEVIGVVAAVRRGSAPRQLPSEMVERVRGLAHQAATAFDNARLVATLQEQIRALEESEQALREARGILAHIIDSGPIITFRGTTEGFRITFVSSNVERIMGFDAETFLGSRWLEFVHPDDVESVWEHVQRTRTQSEVEFSMRFVDALDRYRWLRVHLRGDPSQPGDRREILGYVWDQTEQVEAEDRYRIVSELTSDIAYSWLLHDDGSTSVEWVAGSVERITGYTAEELSELGGWPAILLPEDQPAFQGRLSRLSAGETVTDEFRVRVRSGEVRWLRISARPALEEGTGQVRRVFGAVQDVTEERLAEELHRVISESMSDFAFAYRVRDGGLIIDWVVGAVERITGHPLTSPPPAQLFTPIAHPDDRTRIQAAEAQVLRGENSVEEFRILTPEGEERWLRIYASPVTDSETGEVVRVYGAAQDVTDRRRIEEALSASEQRLRSVVDASPVPILALDSRERLVLWNPAAERVFGWRVDEVLGTAAPLVPDSMRVDFEQIFARVRRGERLTNLETRRQRKDGEVIDVVISAAPLELDDGEVGAIAVVADISERKRLERQIQQAEKMSALGRLAGGVAHDFNNLLTAIVGHAEFLVDEADDPEQVRESAEAIQVAADQAAGLTAQMLMLSRHQEPDAAVLDLGEVVGSMVPTLSSLVGDAITLSARLVDHAIWVRIPRSQLEQVFLNLVVNARDAMPRGGELTVETVSKAMPDGREAGVIRVRDTGVGMDRAVRDHLFEPFFTTKASGTGLGLAVVYSVVEAAGGTISVESAPDAGSCFEVYLPIVTDEEVRPAEPVGDRAGTGGGETVLVVEDEDTVRRLLRRSLERLGYAVVEAVDGAEALDRAETLPTIDVLLTDIVMPGLDGPDLAAMLKRHHPDLPVVYISGYRDRIGDASEGRDERVMYLQKPFTPSQLAAVLRRVLDHPE